MSGNRYTRDRGHRPQKGPKIRSISFSWTKKDRIQGETYEEWERDGLLAQFCDMMQQIGQHDACYVLANQMIKQYTKVGFPPDSGFNEPKHVSPTYWAVIHIKPSSKEVVVGYLEEDVFYIVFFDKDHKFWPPKSIQDRGKTKR